MSTRDPIESLAHEAKVNPEFFHALSTDPDRALAENPAGKSEKKPVTKRVNPKRRSAARVGGGGRGGGGAPVFCFDATCGEESCQWTCGPRSCGFTCSISCTGDTCKDSCGHTTGIAIARKKTQ